MTCAKVCALLTALTGLAWAIAQGAFLLQRVGAGMAR